MSTRDPPKNVHNPSGGRSPQVEKTVDLNLLQFLAKSKKLRSILAGVIFVELDAVG